jgi:transcriptional regulator with XRE-family HTH domain
MKGELHILEPTMVRRKTMGKRLEEARLALRMSLKDVQERIAEEFRSEIGETTIRAAEKDRFPNPGIKTIELIAKAVDLPPLEVIALHLDEPSPSSEEAFERSRFGQLYRLYKEKSPARKAFYDEHLDMLLEKMKKD